MTAHSPLPAINTGLLRRNRNRLQERLQIAERIAQDPAMRPFQEPSLLSIQGLKERIQECDFEIRVAR